MDHKTSPPPRRGGHALLKRVTVEWGACIEECDEVEAGRRGAYAPPKWERGQSLCNGRYVIVGAIDQGVYGCVYEAIDTDTRWHVAIKAFEPSRVGYRDYKHETTILRRLQPKGFQPGIVSLVETFVDDARFPCIVMERLGPNLVQVLEQQQKKLDPKHVWHVGRQLLDVLDRLRTHGVIHTDLKPENILLSRRSQSSSLDVVVADFGMALLSDDRPLDIQPRLYRAPEVFLGCDYGYEIDRWSVACVLFELVDGSPLFGGHGGVTSDVDMFGRIVAMLGPVPTDMLRRGTRTNCYFDHTGAQDWTPNAAMKKAMAASPRTSLQERLVKCLDATRDGPHAWLFSFLTQSLCYEPSKRVTIDKGDAKTNG
jgi:serine/threonine protein kinase